jgi:hypothetical protein
MHPRIARNSRDPILKKGKFFNIVLIFLSAGIMLKKSYSDLRGL